MYLDYNHLYQYILHLKNILHQYELVHYYYYFFGVKIVDEGVCELLGVDVVGDVVSGEDVVGDVVTGEDVDVLDLESLEEKVFLDVLADVSLFCVKFV